MAESPEVEQLQLMMKGRDLTTSAVNLQDEALEDLLLADVLDFEVWSHVALTTWLIGLSIP